MQPKITVITASYNAENTIEQTIVSVLSQTYSELEYIIVDGKSTDNTLKIINKYTNDKRLIVISEPDEGLYDALNKGVKNATGDFVEIIGADDALADKNVIKDLVAEMDENVDIVSGLEYGVAEKTHRQHMICDNHIARDKNNYKGGMIGHAAMLSKRELLLKYPFDKTYKIAADYKFFLQCYYDKSVNFKFTDRVVAFFSLSGMSSDRKMCQTENTRLYGELGLDFNNVITSNDRSSVKNMIKKFLYLIGAWDCFFINYGRISYYFYSNYIWDKHKCDNKICRWCNRNIV